jgi:N-acetylmuramic acid 6-phosphate (MurNAc-6-P) etherase
VLTGQDQDAARQALEKADGKVKLAVLLLHGLDRPLAETLLAQNGGRLRETLASVLDSH